MAIVTFPSFTLPHGFLGEDNPTLASQANFQSIEEHLQYPWHDWAPTYANLTVGNGTVVARYVQIGKTVHFNYELILGSTSAVGTAPTVSFPVTTTSSGHTTVLTPLGVATFQDTGTTVNIGTTLWVSTTTMGPRVTGAGSTYAVGNTVTATVPFTWTTTDILVLNGTYEVA